MWRVSFFWVLIILAILSWLSWYIVLHNISPVQSPSLAFPLFYATFFCAITFTASLITALLWKAIIPTKSSYYCLKNGIREGGLLGIVGSVALFFQQYQYLGWQEIALLLALVLLIEVFFVVQSQ